MTANAGQNITQVHVHGREGPPHWCTCVVLEGSSIYLVLLCCWVMWQHVLRYWNMLLLICNFKHLHKPEERASQQAIHKWINKMPKIKLRQHNAQSHNKSLLVEQHLHHHLIGLFRQLRNEEDLVRQLNSRLCGCNCRDNGRPSSWSDAAYRNT